MFFRICAVLIASVTVGEMTWAQPTVESSTSAVPCADRVSESPPPQLIFNQRTGEACLVTTKGSSRRIEPNSKVRIRQKELEIRVTHTLTPFNTYWLEESTTETAELASLYRLFEATRPYLVDRPTTTIRLPPIAGEREHRNEMDEAEIHSLVTDLRVRLNERLPDLLLQMQRLLIRNSAEDEYGLEELRIRVISALSDLADSQHSDPSGKTALAIRDALRTDLEPIFRANTRELTLTRELIETYRQLNLETEALQRVAVQLAQVGELSPTDSAQTHQRLLEAGKQLAQAEETLTSVHIVQEAALSAMGTETEWSRVIPIRRFTDRTVHLRVQPQVALGVSSSADERTLDVTLKREWVVHPNLGLTLLYADRATYASAFGVEDRNGTPTIVVTDQTDERANWALTLGLTPYFLDWDEWKITPQFHLTPTGDVNALGVGGAVSYSFLNFSVGALWTKHKVLTDLEVGDVVSSDTELKTEDTYGSPKLFVGISIRGIRSFVR